METKQNTLNVAATTFNVPYRGCAIHNLKSELSIAYPFVTINRHFVQNAQVLSPTSGERSDYAQNMRPEN